MNKQPTAMVMHHIDESGERIIRWPVELTDETKQIIAVATN